MEEKADEVEKNNRPEGEGQMRPMEESESGQREKEEMTKRMQMGIGMEIGKKAVEEE